MLNKKGIITHRLFRTRRRHFDYPVGLYGIIIDIVPKVLYSCNEYIVLLETGEILDKISIDADEFIV